MTNPPNSERWPISSGKSAPTAFAGSPAPCSTRTAARFDCIGPAGLRQFAARKQAADIVVTSVPYNQEQIVERARALITAAKKRNIPIGAVSSTATFAGCSPMSTRRPLLNKGRIARTRRR